jgi:hypothetical protein
MARTFSQPQGLCVAERSEIAARYKGSARRVETAFRDLIDADTFAASLTAWSMTDFRGNREASRVRDGRGEGIHDVRHGGLSRGHPSTAESQGRPAKHEQGHSQFSDIAEAAPEAGHAPEGLLPT